MDHNRIGRVNCVDSTVVRSLEDSVRPNLAVKEAPLTAYPRQRSWREKLQLSNIDRTEETTVREVLGRAPVWTNEDCLWNNTGVRRKSSLPDVVVRKVGGISPFYLQSF